MTLSELADAVEGLSGPDREMDAAIFRAIGAPLPDEFAGKKIALTFDEARHAFFMDVGSDMVVRYEPPAYTASIDAAMTLVPEGIGETPLSVMLQRTWEGIGKVRLLDSLGGQVWDGNASTPALALTAAALRARAALASENSNAE
ncbi:MAG: hypothetical protein AB1431_12595 [Pseudomonadota bacterium]